MTKRNLVLVSLFLVFGLTAMAPTAQATLWSYGANGYNYGRTEGLSESTGQATVAILSGGTVSAGSYFTFTYNMPSSISITSLATVYVQCTGAGTSPWASGTCVNLYPPTLDTAKQVVTLTFQYDTDFTTGDQSQIAVTVRLNVTSMGPAGGNVYAVMQAFPPAGGKQFTLSPKNPSDNELVLTVRPFPSLSLGFDPYKGKLTDVAPGAAEVLSCIGAKDIGSYENEFIINVDENFVNALTTSDFESLLDPGAGGIAATDVTNPSDFIVTFSNVPAGMTITNSDLEDDWELDSGDPFFNLSGTLDVILLSDETVSCAASAAPCTLSFTYEVDTLDNGFPESVSLTYKIKSQGPLPPGLTPIGAEVAYTPSPPTSAIPLFTGAPELVSKGAATPLPVVTFSDCVTNLLFPYINAYVAGSKYGAFANFGTGIVVANTTKDPFGLKPETALGTAAPQSGTCTFYLYPSATAYNSSGQPTSVTLGTPVTPYVTPTIPAGGTIVFDVATAVPGFTGDEGYGIAICQFQNGVGYAEIYDNYGLPGAPTATLAYLAYVIPNPTFYHRSPAGDSLGEFAIAPYNIKRALERLVLYGIAH